MKSTDWEPTQIEMDIEDCLMRHDGDYRAALKEVLEEQVTLIIALQEISKDEWEFISQSTGIRQSGPSHAAMIAMKALGTCKK